MKSAEIAELLDHCLERLAAGERLEDVLIDYPAAADELRQLLPLAQVYQLSRPPAPSLARRAQGKQAMLTAVESAFPAVQPAWWQRLSGRSLGQAAAAVALTALIIVAAFVLRGPAAETAAELPVAATQAVTKATSVVTLRPTAGVEVAAAEPTAAATATLPPTVVADQGSGGGLQVAAPMTEAEVQGTATMVAAAGVPTTGEADGLSVSPGDELLAGEWAIAVIRDTVLAEPWPITLEAGNFFINSSCGLLAGQYIVDGATLAFTGESLAGPVACTAASAAQLTELQETLPAVASWFQAPDESIILLDAEGDELLQFSRPVE